MDTSVEGIGPYLRFRTLPLAALPSHPDLSGQQPLSSSDHDVTEFAENLLDEARAFLKSYVPAHAVVKTENKASSPATAPVTLWNITVPASVIPERLDYTPSRNNSHVSAKSYSSVDSQGQPRVHDETWHMRTSTHANAAEKGTASWPEFKDALIHDHARREQEYTPNVYDAHCVLTYALPSQHVRWRELQMGIYEMGHEMPVPLRNRCFPVLVVSGVMSAATGPKASALDKEFITVQLPVSLTGVSKALYTSGRNKLDGDEAVKRKDVVFGKYVSIERCELLEPGVDGQQQILWEMATSSDAGGALPTAVQRMATPNAIAKDVGLVTEWLDRKRTGRLKYL